MNILSVDTTTKKAVVTLKKDDKIYENEIDNEVTHSEKFLPLIDKTLKDASINLKDIDKYLILNGPGSFTGIRISLATLKAINYVYNKPIFSISSMEALAFLGFKNSNKKYISCFIDAKNDRVYFCLYRLEKIDNKISISPLFDIKNDYFEDAIKAIDTFLNENNIKKDDLFSIGNIENLDLNAYPNTLDLLEIYENIENEKNYLFDTYTLNAIYARPSQAERVKNGER